MIIALSVIIAEEGSLSALIRKRDGVGDLMNRLFREMTTNRGPESGGFCPNLFAAHPPFQIDANLGS